MTKAEIQLKAAQEMRFVMVNSSFNPKSAKDAINEANSKGAQTQTSFKDQAMREMQYFTDYVTGGFYAKTDLRKKVHRITDKEAKSKRAATKEGASKE